MLSRGTADGAGGRLRFTGVGWGSAIIARPVGRRAGHLARHNLIDLCRINRLVLHECVSHQIELVPVVFQQLMRLRVALINDASHFPIDCQSGLVRHRLCVMIKQRAQVISGRTTKRI